MWNIYKIFVLITFELVGECKRPIAPYHESLKVKSILEVKEKTKRV